MKYSTNQFDTKLKYQKYSHYLLPIAWEPLKYGKLIEQFGNKYIIQLNTSNILVIKVVDNDNFIRLFRKGDLVLDFTDSKVNEKIFTRTISDQRFTFENNKLITTEILTVLNAIKIYEDITPLSYKDTNSVLIKNNHIFSNLDKLVKSILNYCKNLYWFDFILYPYLAIIFIGMFCFIILLILHILTGLESWISADKSFVCTSLLNTSMKGNIVKLRRSFNRNAWDEYRIPFFNKIFSKDLFEKLIKKFWVKIEDEFTNNNHLYLLFKIQYSDGNFATVGTLQRLNKDDLTWYIKLIISLIQFKSEFYKEAQINEIIISYGFKNEKIPNKTITASTTNTTEFNKINIINSMIPSDFGTIIKTIKLDNKTIFVIQNELGWTISLDKFNKYNLVTIAFKGKVLLTFRDEFISSNEFVRIVGDKKYYFKDNLQVLFLKDLKTKFISKIKKLKN